MNFNENLEDLFNRFEASPMLFIGSGMSRRYIELECWLDLLKKFTDKISENYNKINTSSNGNLPEYASVLAETYNKKWWATSESSDIQKEYEGNFKNNSSVLKIEISRYLKNVGIENIESFKKYDNEISLLREVTIDGIITTNWDLLLEKLFPEFTVFVGQNELLTGRCHGISEIYKIHGCSSKPNSLVLTSEDYKDYGLKNPYLCSKLLTIFVERPVIFLGYSLDDKHITEILDNIIGCCSNENIDFLKNKLIFVEWKKGIESVITDSIIHKIPVKLIRTDDYTQLFEVLASRKRRIPAHIFRAIKDQLYDLVITNDPKGLLYVTDGNLDHHQSINEFVVGVGAISKVKQAEAMQEQGLTGLERIDIIREILFESEHHDVQKVVSIRLPKLCKGKVNVPVFYYLNKSGYIDENAEINFDIDSKLKEKVNIDITAFHTTTESKTFKKSKLDNYRSISQLYDEDKKHFFAILPYMNTDLIRNELDFLLKILRDEFDSELKTHFVKAVCVYDFIKYSNKFGITN